MRTKEQINDLYHIIQREKIYSVFQPIISLRDASILGYEALSRMDGSFSIPNIEALFQIAIEEQMVWKLERVARKAAFREAARQHADSSPYHFFLNVSPYVMNEKKFRAGFTEELINNYGIKPSQVTFEITERESVNDISTFKKIIEHYKEEHYQIAIDDVGSGYSGLNLICDIKPHYIKLDMNLVRDIDKNNMKYAMVKGLIELSTLSNIRIIAEGIETKEELETLIDLGVHYGQGYYIRRPQRLFGPLEEQLIEEVKTYNQRKHSMLSHDVDSFYIKNIVSKGLTVSKQVNIGVIMDHLERNVNIAGITVLEDEKVVGILSREKFFRQLSGRYGYSLYHKKNIGHIMQERFLEVESHMPINAVSSIAMERTTDELYDFIVVNEGEKYLGIVTVKDLLKKATKIDITMAKSENPLTGLPGNLRISQEINACISQKKACTFLYLDLDNFKSFNDTYGFEKGDIVIQLLADTLKSFIQKPHFIGHIGGDDFVLILHDFTPKDLICDFISAFERKAHALYTPCDQERGYIIAKNRSGEIEQFPLVTLTAVSAHSSEGQFSNYQELSELLSARKKTEKNQKKQGFSIA